MEWNFVEYSEIVCKPIPIAIKPSFIAEEKTIQSISPSHAL
jgi:hypothetical protein